MAVDRDKEVYFAELAEQAERYDEMANHMEAVGKLGAGLSDEERNILSVAHKDAVGSRHDQRGAEGDEQRERGERKVRQRVLCEKVEGKLDEICKKDPGCAGRRSHHESTDRRVEGLLPAALATARPEVSSGSGLLARRSPVADACQLAVTFSFDEEANSFKALADRWEVHRPGKGEVKKDSKKRPAKEGGGAMDTSQSQIKGSKHLFRPRKVFMIASLFARISDIWEAAPESIGGEAKKQGQELMTNLNSLEPKTWNHVFTGFRSIFPSPCLATLGCGR
ncbi:unnamed protein product [Prorocentrum cordatum]|uniref:14-3-3 domain-containing protein n=1 Tax=Prorocentrum cordatum TaxID=2364126 RepID=A0ABN9WMW9_9DINO|nr:unnamed protein product [Polarella glacialis]